MTTEEKIVEFDKILSMKFPLVRRLSFSQVSHRNGSIEQCVSIELQQRGGGKTLWIELLDPRDLVFHQPSWSEVLISHLAIRPIDNGIGQEPRYCVYDAEQDEILKLNCRDFVLSIVENEEK
jgi:hypothetical protein